MLRLKDIIPSIRLGQAAGLRPHDHFDHDASNVSGPSSDHDTVESYSSVEPTEPQDDVTSSNRKLAYIAYIDPETGELLHKLQPISE